MEAAKRRGDWAPGVPPGYRRRYGERSDRRRPSDPYGQAQRTPLGLAPRGAGWRNPQRPRRAQQPRPRLGRRCDHGMRDAGRRAEHQRRPQRRAQRRVAGIGSLHHRGPAMRFLTAVGSFRRPGGDGGCLRRGRSRRRRGDEPRADGSVGTGERRRHAILGFDGRPLRRRRRAPAAGNRGGDDRREVGHHSRTARRLRAPKPRIRGSGPR